jgi:hypothetical protein
METNRIDPSSQPVPTPLKTKIKSDPYAPPFMQTLVQAVETATSKTLKTELANLARQVRPRCHVNLVGLNPMQAHYIPEAAVLERVSKLRVVPFKIG